MTISQSFILPQNVLYLIKEYSKPQTRPDWKTNIKLSFIQFYYGIRKEMAKKKVLYKLHYTIQNGYNNFYVYGYYMRYLQDYNQRVALERIEKELHLDPKLVIIMNSYFHDYY